MSVIRRKKWFVNPIKIKVTRRARTETILGKSPAIFNGHQPPRADDPYMCISILVKYSLLSVYLYLDEIFSIKSASFITHRWDLSRVLPLIRERKPLILSTNFQGGTSWAD